MTNSEIFTSAHRIARETRASFESYRKAFSAALKGLYAMTKENTWNTIADWFCVKSSIDAYAFNDRQIVSETEKALKVRTAIKWGNGLSIVKEIWIPKSVCKRGLAKSDLGEYGAIPFECDAIIKSVEEGTNCYEFSKWYIGFMASCFC